MGGLIGISRTLKGGMTDLDLLHLDSRTLFVLTEQGRILRENDPDRSPGPKLWFAGSADGNAWRLNHSVVRDVAAEIEALAAEEPSFQAQGTLPRHIARYEKLLAALGVCAERSLALVHDLPHHLDIPRNAGLIASGSAGGARFVADIESRGMPANLIDLHMRKVKDLWAPWVIHMEEGEVASMAFTARLAAEGAELGLVTAPKFRGRGFARLVTAAWTNLPALADRQLFYGADRDNLASRRVIAYLGLRRIGVSLRLSPRVAHLQASSRTSLL